MARRLGSIAASASERGADRAAQGFHVRRSRERVATAVADARARGQRTLDAGRSEAEAMLQRGLVGAVNWAGKNIMPRLVERLGPRLADEVVPRLVADAEAAVRTHHERPSTQDTAAGSTRLNRTGAR
jgi:hypothetical protein